ncbi:MAG: glycosyltransferase family 1 protein [Deltaproteobacteria bacterium]|nr:glycosyltransferase family 1 protein [Deltaproteobacteria bacterium]
MSQRARVVLHARVLWRPLTGVGHYASQLLRALAELAPPDLEVRAFPGPARGRERALAPVSRAPAPFRRRWPATERTRDVARRLLEPPYEALYRWRTRGFDLYHEPNHVPVATRVPTVTTVHDVSVLTHPEWHPAHRVHWYERHFERGRRQTCRFLAVSEFTKRELVERLGVPADRIDVTLQAARPGFVPRPPEASERQAVALEIPARFFLFVGTLEPRKNLAMLADAHARLPAELRRRHPLVLAGARGWDDEALRERLRLRQDAGEVRVLGYVDDETLAGLYGRCTALVWPSLYEGFGLPPLEAMACGAATITSNAASLPEVVGEGGVLLDPHDLPGWTDAMRRMAEDAAWREQWRHLGPRQAARFSWRRCAEQTAAAYRRALGRA